MQEDVKRCRYCGAEIKKGVICSWCCHKRQLIRQIQDMLRPVKEERDKRRK